MVPKRKLSNESSPYGAPMGRRDVPATDMAREHEMRLEKLPFEDGDYDRGGAYWGNTPGTAIYWAYGEDEEVQFEMFVRANSRDEAKAKVREKYPNASFYS
jgi:hypothetical protein